MIKKTESCYRSLFLQEAAAKQLLRQALADLGETVTAAEDRSQNQNGIPGSFLLEQNYSNPIQYNGALALAGESRTSIRYALPIASEVEVRLYNLLGQSVATLVAGSKPAGVHVINWDGRTSAGTIAPAGIYFYEMRTGEFVQVRKLLIVR